MERPRPLREISHGGGAHRDGMRTLFRCSRHDGLAELAKLLKAPGGIVDLVLLDIFELMDVELILFASRNQANGVSVGLAPGRVQPKARQIIESTEAN